MQVWIGAGAAAVVALVVVLVVLWRDPDGVDGRDGAPAASGQELENVRGYGPGALDH